MSVFLPDEKMTLDFFMPSFANGKLFYLPKQQQEMSLTGGCLSIGSTTAECVEKKGLSIDLVQANLDLDPWDSYFQATGR